MKEKIKAFVVGMKRPKMERRIPALFAAVALMGFGVAVFDMIGFGADPYSVMNLGLSMNLPLSFGTLQFLVNALMLIFVIRYDTSRIGLGTLANMTVVGYVAEFFMFVIDQFPALETLSLTMRIIVFIPTLVLFLLAASTYMCVDMGVAPYDAIPQIIAARKGWSFRVVRTLWDLVTMTIGVLLGATAGPVTVGIMLFIGSLVAWMSVYVRRFFD